MAWLRFVGDGFIDPLESVSLEGTGGKAVIGYSKGMIEFGNVGIGTQARDTTWIRNTGSGAVLLLRQTLSGPDSADFSIIQPAASPLHAGDSAMLVLGFFPPRKGSAVATFTCITNEHANASSIRYVTGNGVGPVLTMNKSGLSFGTVFNNWLTIDSLRVTNTGSVPLHIQRQYFSGPDSASFLLIEAAPSTLAPGASARVLVGCRPGKTGPLQAMIHFFSDDNWAAIQVYLLTASVLDVAIRLAPSPLVFDSTVLGNTLTLPVHMENLSPQSAQLLSLQIEGNDAADFGLASNTTASIAAKSTVDAKITFTPSRLGRESTTLRFHFIDVRPYDLLVQVEATGARFPLDIRPSPLRFDTSRSLATLVSHFTIVNTSSQRQKIGPIDWMTGSRKSFTITAPATTKFEPGDSTQVTVTFRPAWIGDLYATFRIWLTTGSKLDTRLLVTGYSVDMPNAAEAPARPYSMLGDPYPQPAGDIVTVPFSLARADHAVLSVHDALGRRVAVLADDSFAAGEHARSYDTRTLPCGVYLVTLETGSATRLTRRLLIAR
jgi:hypothetical protein